MRDEEQVAMAGSDAHFIKLVMPDDLMAAIEAAVADAAQARGSAAS